MGATKEPLKRQNTLPNTTHTYTQEEGKHRAISNLKSWNWILQRRRRPFLTDQCPMEDMRTNEPDGMPYWNAHCFQGTYPPLIFFKCKVGCFCLLTQSPRPISNMAPPFPGHPRPVRRGLSSHLPIHLKTPNAHWDPIWGRGRGLERARSGEEPWKRRGKKNRTTWQRGKENKGERWRMTRRHEETSSNVYLSPSLASPPSSSFQAGGWWVDWVELPSLLHVSCTWTDHSHPLLLSLYRWEYY